MTESTIKVDIGETLEILKANPDLAGMINTLVFPTLARTMEHDSKLILHLQQVIDRFTDALNRIALSAGSTNAAVAVLGAIAKDALENVKFDPEEWPDHIKYETKPENER